MSEGNSLSPTLGFSRRQKPIYTSPPLRCKVLWSASLYAYLSVCLSARISQKPHVLISAYFLYMYVARSSSDGSAIRYMLPVLWMFSYNIFMFSHNGRNRPESKTTRIMHTLHVSSSSSDGGTSRRQTTLFGQYCQVAAPHRGNVVRTPSPTAILNVVRLFLIRITATADFDR